MKKIFVTICIAAASVLSANAQNNLLNALKSVAGSVAGDAISNVLSGATGQSVNLAGTWTYNGIAADVKSDNILTSMAGKAAVGTIESKVDAALAKVGFKPGAATFTFNQDGTFVLQSGSFVKLNGTYTLENSHLVMKFGKALTYLTLEGTASTTLDGCKVLFNGQKFLVFAQKLSEYIGKITTSASVASVGNLLATAKSVDAGFKLTR